MKQVKLVVLLAVLAIAGIGMVTAPALAAGFDCEGAGDDCTISWERENGSTVEISGDHIVNT